MSVLMNAGKKAAQAKAEKEMQKKKKKAAAAAAARRSQAAAAVDQGPPMSSPATSVWYWVLDGQPTTVMYHKPKKEVWCNGYLIETYEGNREDDESNGDLTHDMGDVMDFAIFAAGSQRSHRGRVERIPAKELSWPACESTDGQVVGSHRLWVDDALIPEYTDQVPTLNNTDYFQDYTYDDDDDDDDEFSLGGSGPTKY